MSQRREKAKKKKKKKLVYSEGKDLYHQIQDFMTMIQALGNLVQGEMSSSTHQELRNKSYVWRNITYDRGGITGLGVEFSLNEVNFLGGPVVKSLPVNAGDTGLIPGPGRSHVPRGN